MTISVVIPAKNEQDNIQPLVTEIVTALMAVDNYEIIYVDDGSDFDYSHIILIQSRLSLLQRGAGDAATKRPQPYL